MVKSADHDGTKSLIRLNPEGNIYILAETRNNDSHSVCTVTQEKNQYGNSSSIFVAVVPSPLKVPRRLHIPPQGIGHLAIACCSCFCKLLILVKKKERDRERERERERDRDRDTERQRQTDRETETETETES